MKKPPPVYPGTATFPVPLYGGRVIICINRPSYQKVHVDLEEEEYPKAKENAGLSSEHIERGSRAVYLIGLFDGGKQTLVHELAHIVFMVLSRAGVPINARNDEAFAYLMDSLYGESIKAIRGIRSKKSG